MTPIAEKIFQDVYHAMQQAEGFGGPEGLEYDTLMNKIAAEAVRRRDTYRSYHKTDSVSFAAKLRPLSHRWFHEVLYRQLPDVPDDIGTFAEEFCRQFKILGQADPAYVCNVVANESKRGDGKGSFAEQPGHDRHQRAHCYSEAAKRLAAAYGDSIFKRAGLLGTGLQASGEVYKMMVRNLDF